MVKGKKTLREIDRPFYHYWQALYHSFFNNELYVDVGKRWKGLGIGYLLLLMFVVTLPFALRVATDFNRFFVEDLVQPLQQLPTLYIQNGTVSLDKPMPYVVKNKYNQVVAIVDTTGTVKTIDKTYPFLSILITKDKLFYRFPSPQFFFNINNVQNPVSPIYVYPFNEHSNAVFDGKEWVKASGMSKLKLFFAILIYPTVALVFFAIFLIILLAFALMGQFIAKLFKFSITYKQSSRLTMVSITPFMAVLWILLTLGRFSNQYGFFMPLLFIAYFCYAVISLKRESQKLVVA
ncbi:DUF1189 family protein [Legionella micdadei]|uniref:DUF1189 domain-containing protein n=1 Tax=Legionella micdadei TaxID=451 RepID=A0A098GIA8_LEGMI|nr:DUF1189 family protein [Legionella micdadei]ARG97327.1 hypothetical protein B6N58_06450 [Legionella micdadei]ARH00364.1 hypothetical protein B6V88_07970 [Legionella micdadei]KTD28212.1 hypothetical protein Lmic_1323 [Legionella micdadei]NSL16841.1 DUF1189 family protein [Legionella micdadei]CEG61201.1 conserved membrane protein of unknown function [Legionella micdadei]